MVTVLIILTEHVTCFQPSASGSPRAGRRTLHFLKRTAASASFVPIVRASLYHPRNM
jgi:hypothetical protein